MVANLDCVRNALELFKFNEMKIGNEICFKTVCERETEENNRKKNFLVGNILATLVKMIEELLYNFRNRQIVIFWKTIPVR